MGNLAMRIALFLVCAALFLAAGEAGRGEKEHVSKQDVSPLHDADEASLKVANAAENVASGVKAIEDGLYENMRKKGNNDALALAKDVDTDAQKYNMIKLEKSAKRKAETAMSSD